MLREIMGAVQGYISKQRGGCNRREAQLLLLNTLRTVMGRGVHAGTGYVAILGLQHALEAWGTSSQQCHCFQHGVFTALCRCTGWHFTT